MLRKNFKDIVKGDYVFVLLNSCFYIEYVLRKTTNCVKTNLATYRFDEPIDELCSFKCKAHDNTYCACNFKELIHLIIKKKNNIKSVFLLGKNFDYTKYSIDEILNRLKMNPDFFNNYSKDEN